VQNPQLKGHKWRQQKGRLERECGDCGRWTERGETVVRAVLSPRGGTGHARGGVDLCAVPGQRAQRGGDRSSFAASATARAPHYRRRMAEVPMLATSGSGLARQGIGCSALKSTHRSTWETVAAPVATSGRVANRDQRRATATVKNRSKRCARCGAGGVAIAFSHRRRGRVCLVCHFA
jgi:ribosomal protein S14